MGRRMPRPAPFSRLESATIGLMHMDLFATSILTIDPGDWYFAPTAIIICLSVGLIVFGYRISTARAPLLGSRGG